MKKLFLNATQLLYEIYVSVAGRALIKVCMQQGAAGSGAYVLSQRLWGVREGTEVGGEVAAGWVDLGIESKVNAVDMVIPFIDDYLNNLS